MIRIGTMRAPGRRAVAGAAALTLVTALLAACGGSSGDSTEQVLRIAIPAPGEKQAAAWKDAQARFEKAQPGWKVELTLQDDDLYSTVGLQNLLTGGKSPDIYFEWSGNRLQTRYKDGFAADLTQVVKTSGVADRFAEGAFNGTQVDGKTVMVPLAKDVSNVIWYNKTIFAKQGITPPTTWAEFTAAAAKLKAAGITPLAVGNKDLWPAGNWAAHLISRVAGEQAYAETLELKRPMNSPEFVKALDLLKQVHDQGWVNESANSINDNESYTLFFKGKAAMLPIGSWLVASQTEQAPDLSMGWFNLPEIAGGAGNQKSILGVSTGYVVNAKSTKVAQAMTFFSVLYSDEVTKQFADAGDSPLVKGYSDAAGQNPLSTELATLVGTAPAIVSPPDTGYRVKVADALYQAVSAVLGGLASPSQALAEADKQVASLKQG
jgi:ABC-type glycerol-3-phosphate transport system substrate-binding protein